MVRNQHLYDIPCHVAQLKALAQKCAVPVEYLEAALFQLDALNADGTGTLSERFHDNKRTKLGKFTSASNTSLFCHDPILSPDPLDLEFDLKFEPEANLWNACENDILKTMELEANMMCWGSDCGPTSPQIKSQSMQNKHTFLKRKRVTGAKIVAMFMPTHQPSASASASAAAFKMVTSGYTPLQAALLCNFSLTQRNLHKNHPVARTAVEEMQAALLLRMSSSPLLPATSDAALPNVAVQQPIQTCRTTSDSRGCNLQSRPCNSPCSTSKHNATGSS